MSARLGTTGAKGFTIMPFAVAVAGVSVLHFFASFLLAFQAGIHGGVWRVLSTIITLPISALPDSWLPTNGAAGWVAWGLTSVGWGWGICALVRHLLRPS